jgi:hypothetical protein
MRTALWPNETALALIRPDRQVYWFIQGITLCAAFGSANFLAFLWRASDGDGGGGSFFQALIGAATVAAPILFGAWRDLQQAWILTDRRVILGADAYILLEDLTDVRAKWAGLTLTAGGDNQRVARLSALINPQDAAERIRRARETGR